MYFSTAILSTFLLPWVHAFPGNYSFSPADIISSDVAIIGGGSAGCYSAISLIDKGQSVVVIEKTDRVGGNTQAYIDPTTGTRIDIGVLVFHNTSVVGDYFQRFDIPLTLYDSAADNTTSGYYDFRSGEEVNITFPSANETAVAFENYAAFLEKYPLLNDGLFLPNPVPED